MKAIEANRKKRKNIVFKTLKLPEKLHQSFLISCENHKIFISLEIEESKIYALQNKKNVVLGACCKCGEIYSVVCMCMSWSNLSNRTDHKFSRLTLFLT